MSLLTQIQKNLNLPKKSHYYNRVKINENPNIAPKQMIIRAYSLRIRRKQIKIGWLKPFKQ